MNRPYAFKSIYDDYTLGTSITYENTDLKNNNFSLAGHYKHDVHREHNVGEPTRRAADQNYTIGAEDTYHLTSALKVNAGVSYMDRQSDGAEQYNSTTKVISSFLKTRAAAGTCRDWFSTISTAITLSVFQWRGKRGLQPLKTGIQFDVYFLTVR